LDFPLRIHIFTKRIRVFVNLITTEKEKKGKKFKKGLWGWMLLMLLMMVMAEANR